MNVVSWRRRCFKLAPISPFPAGMLWTHKVFTCCLLGNYCHPCRVHIHKARGWLNVHGASVKLLWGSTRTVQGKAQTLQESMKLRWTIKKKLCEISLIVVIKLNVKSLKWKHSLRLQRWTFGRVCSLHRNQPQYVQDSTKLSIPRLITLFHLCFLSKCPFLTFIMTFSFLSIRCHAKVSWWNKIYGRTVCV